MLGLQAFDRKMPTQERAAHLQALYAEYVEDDKEELLEIYALPKRNAALIPGPTGPERGQESSAIEKIEVP